MYTVIWQGISKRPVSLYVYSSRSFSQNTDSSVQEQQCKTLTCSGQISANGGQKSANSGQMSTNGGQILANGGQMSINGGQMSAYGGHESALARQMSSISIQVQNMKQSVFRFKAKHFRPPPDQISPHLLFLIQLNKKKGEEGCNTRKKIKK